MYFLMGLFMVPGRNLIDVTRARRSRIEDLVDARCQRTSSDAGVSAAYRKERGRCRGYPLGQRTPDLALDVRAPPSPPPV